MSDWRFREALARLSPDELLNIIEKMEQNFPITKMLEEVVTCRSKMIGIEIDVEGNLLYFPFSPEESSVLQKYYESGSSTHGGCCNPDGNKQCAICQEFDYEPIEISKKDITFSPYHNHYWDTHSKLHRRIKDDLQWIIKRYKIEFTK
jgi:hypothetical protein